MPRLINKIHYTIDNHYTYCGKAGDQSNDWNTVSCKQCMRLRIRRFDSKYYGEKRA